jgi:signal transduction histidine kinase
LELPHAETAQESLDRLGLEVEELRASRERLVLATDVDRRGIERELHDGPQQLLVALAVNVQLARTLADEDPVAAGELLDEIGRDIGHALEETGKLAHRIYPPLLEAGGLAAALRAAAANLGSRARIEVPSRASFPPEVAGLVYFCCLEVLECAGRETPARVTVREGEGAIVFEVVAEAGASPSGAVLDLARWRDRVEALGGRVTVDTEPGGDILVAGSLPVPR